MVPTVAQVLTFQQLEAVHCPLSVGVLGEGDGMHIGELARDAGVPAKTIRYYEDVGLLPAPVRAANGYRAYGRADLGRLLLIRRLRLAGVGLSELRDIVAVAGSGTCAPVRERLLPTLDARLASIDRQLAELAALRTDLHRYRDDLRASLADAAEPGEPFCACDPASCSCLGGRHG